MTGPMAKEDNMPLVTTTEMFKKAYEGAMLLALSM